VIRPARLDERERLHALQSNLREPNSALLAYAVEGPPLVLVATENGVPVGYLVAFYDDEGGYVAEIAVAPAHRREGRAKRLLTTIFDRLRNEGCSRVRLAVHPENEAARELYQSLGFEEVYREDEYYDDGSEGIVLGREL
jgi:ribosomal-protein-alanine N-acetyltransferase